MLFLANIATARQSEKDLSEAVQVNLQASIINPMPAHLVFSNQADASLWLSTMSERLKPFVKDEFLRTQYLTIIQYESLRAGLDPQIVLSLITVESKFNKYSIGTSKEKGLMQVMPFWLNLIGNNQQNLFDVRTNVRYGCNILAFYLQLEKGNMARALARYNGSLKSDSYPNRIFAAYNKYWQPVKLSSN